MEEILAKALRNNLAEAETADVKYFVNLVTANNNSKLNTIKNDDTIFRKLKGINEYYNLTSFIKTENSKSVANPNPFSSPRTARGDPYEQAYLAIQSLNKTDPDKIPILVKLADFLFKFVAGSQQYVIITDEQEYKESTTFIFGVYFITQFIHNCLGFDQIKFIKHFYIGLLSIINYHITGGVEQAKAIKVLLDAILLVCYTAETQYKKSKSDSIKEFSMPETTFASSEQVRKYKNLFNENGKNIDDEINNVVDNSYTMLTDFKNALTLQSAIDRVLFPMTIGFLTSERVPAEIAKTFDIQTVYIVSPFIKVCAGLPPGLRALCHAAQTIKPFYYNLSDESSRVRTELIASILRLGGEMVNIKLTGFEIQVTERDVKPSGAGDWHKLPDVKLFENNPYTWAKLTS